MNQRHCTLGTVALVLAGLVACGDKPSTQANDKVIVQGTVAQGLTAANMRAVAVAADGRWFWADLDTRGDFKLTLPVGQSYRILVTTPDANTQKVVGRLTVDGQNGKTVWISGKEATTVRLGELRPVTPADANTNPSAVSTLSRGGRGGEDVSGSRHGRGGRGGDDDDERREGGDGDAETDDHEHADDKECHEGRKHGAETADVCTRGNEVDLEATGVDEDIEGDDTQAAPPPDKVCPGAAPPDPTVTTDTGQPSAPSSAPPPASTLGGAGSAPPDCTGSSCPPSSAP